jgi:hypothetical protein
MDSIKDGFCYWWQLLKWGNSFLYFRRTNDFYLIPFYRRMFYAALNRGATYTASPPWKVLEDLKYMYGYFPRWDGKQWIEEDFGDD